MIENNVPAVPRAMSRTAMPTPSAPASDVLELLEALLDQRQPDDELMARYFAPEATEERRASDERQRVDDWAALAHYREANASVKSPDVVMMGDSLTQIWGLATPGLFGGAIVNRGIAGQTSAQMLVRFYPDVVDLAPRRVHILCGINDIAGNTGPNLPEDYQRNVQAMIDMALANGIEVLCGSILPTAAAIPWSPDARPLEWVEYLNDWLRPLAASRGLRYIDYHSALADADGTLQPRYSADGVHITRAAYGVMREILKEALA